MKGSTSRSRPIFQTSACYLLNNFKRARGAEKINKGWKCKGHDTTILLCRPFMNHISLQKYVGSR